jgi:hypothetical protein
MGSATHKIVLQFERLYLKPSIHYGIVRTPLGGSSRVRDQFHILSSRALRIPKLAPRAALLRRRSRFGGCQCAGRGVSIPMDRPVSFGPSFRDHLRHASRDWILFWAACRRHSDVSDGVEVHPFRYDASRLGHGGMLVCVYGDSAGEHNGGRRYPRNQKFGFAAAQFHFSPIRLRSSLRCSV